MDNYDEIKTAMEQALATMVSWEIQHKALLDGGCKMSFRNGELMGQDMWFVVLECHTDDEKMLSDIPPQEEWEESVFASVSEGSVFLMFWVFTDYEEMVVEMARLFGIFMAGVTI